MRFSIIALITALAACVDPGPSSAPSCALMATPDELQCSDDVHCTWRGQACDLDACGKPPVYPGYSASPSEDGRWTTIQTSQWNRLTVYMDQMKAFQACEVSRP